MVGLHIGLLSLVSFADRSCMAATEGGHPFRVGLL